MPAAIEKVLPWCRAYISDESASEEKANTDIETNTDAPVTFSQLRHSFT